MNKAEINIAEDYPPTARTQLSGDSKSIVKTFDCLVNDNNLDGVTRVRDEGNTLYSKKINLDAKDGSGYWEFIYLSSDLYLILTDCRYSNTRLETFTGEGFIDLHFKISGELLLELNDEDTLSVRGPSLLIWSQPEDYLAREWVKGDTQDSSFTLYCKPSVFTEQLGLEIQKLPTIIQNFINGKNQNIEYEVIPLNPAMAFSITSLLRSNFTDKFHLFHAKSKAWHLLCDTLQFLSTSSVKDSDKMKPLSSYEKMRLQEARDILSTRFYPPPTISSLAKDIGINETKLKRGFKILFGATIHEYGNYHRMQKALELLQTTELSITEVAQAVGYEYQTSFTAAVKHFFGVTPRQLRNSNQ